MADSDSDEMDVDAKGMSCRTECQFCGIFHIYLLHMPRIGCIDSSTPWAVRQTFDFNIPP